MQPTARSIKLEGFNRDGVMEKETRDFVIQFNGFVFVGYYADDPEVQVNVRSSDLFKAYPELDASRLKCVHTLTEGPKEGGVWYLTQEPESVSDNNDEHWQRLQTKLKQTSEGFEDRRGLIRILEETVERLDDVLDKPKSPHRWADIFIPILEGAAHSGVDIKEILKVSEKKIAHRKSK